MSALKTQHISRSILDPRETRFGRTAESSAREGEPAVILVSPFHLNTPKLVREEILRHNPGMVKMERILRLQHSLLLAGMLLIAERMIFDLSRIVFIC